LLAIASVQPINASTDPPLSSERRPQQAGSYTGIGFTRLKIVGASLLAMGANDNAGCLNERVVPTLFAGKPRSYRESRLLLISTTHQAER
jgi:hypothetical protein